MDRLHLLGLNHTTAALDIRERLAMSAQRQLECISSIRDNFTGLEAVIVSTCNRFELYVAHPSTLPPTAELSQMIAGFTGGSAEDFVGQLYEKSGRAVVDHLFSVASSLDSMVLGETQILGQVRQSYDAARTIGAAGQFLHPLFQRALAVGKQVHNETSLTEGRLSVASVAVDSARRIFDSFADKTVLCIGAGKMTSLVLRHFTELAPGKLLVANRDLEKATKLTQEFGGEAISLDQLAEHLTLADIVITSTSAAHPIITRQMFAPILRKRRYRPVFLIDLAVPRDVEPTVGELEQVYLYNVDDLQKVVAETIGQRSEAVAAARAIVLRHVEDFDAWVRQRELGPAIEQLYARYHQIAKDELNRILTKLPPMDDAAKQQLEEMTRRIVNKVLHDPIHAMRHGDGMHGTNRQYLHAVEKMFKLIDPKENEG